MKNLLFVLALAACGPKTPVAPAPVPAPVEATAEATAEAATLPPAFDPETLRQGFKVGTVLRYKVTSDNTGLVFQEWTVSASDESGCTVHTKEFGADGVTMTDESDHTFTWSDLSGQGQYSAANTTRTESRIDFAGQPIATLYYEQLAIDEYGTNIKTHYAPSLVGPPVWVEMSLGDVVIGTLEMVLYTSP